jgi:hypothetical protein
VSASRPLHDAIRALAPTIAGVPVYVAEVPLVDGLPPAAPWLVLSVETPDSARSLAATHLAGTGRLRVTVCSATEDNAHYLIDAVTHAWRGARVHVDGWNVGALTQTQQSGPYKAGLTATDTDLKYQVAQLWFSFTCSETA